MQTQSSLTKAFTAALANLVVSQITNPVTVSQITNAVSVSQITNPVSVSQITNPVTVTGSVQVSGNTVTSAVEITRPADTLAYTALDTVSDSTTAGTVLTFAGMARANGGSGYITKALLKTDQPTNAVPYRLHLYQTAPTSNKNDNVAFVDLYADKDAYVGFIDFDTTATESNVSGGGSAKSLNKDIRLAFVCGGATTALYGILETRAAFTPTSGQKFSIKLISEQN